MALLKGPTILLPGYFSGVSYPHSLLINLNFVKMKQSVFFRKVNINNDKGTATIICTDEPMTMKQGSFLGHECGTSSSKSLTFGVLSLKDPSTGKPYPADHQIYADAKSLDQGEEIPNFRFTSNPVLNENREETGLYWIEAC